MWKFDITSQKNGCVKIGVSLERQDPLSRNSTPLPIIEITKREEGLEELMEL